MNEAWAQQYDRLVDAFLSWEAYGPPTNRDDTTVDTHSEILIIRLKGTYVKSLYGKI